tara:strand:- start:1110 stop:2429 length:1320 start_codon:yes stop_codon:yes gene_type:complete
MKTIFTVAFSAILFLSSLYSHAQLTVTSPDTNYCVGGYTSLMAYDSNATHYAWYPYNNLSSDTADTVYAFPSDTTTYRVISYNDTVGILDTAYITVNVVPYPVLTTSSTTRGVCANGDTIHIQVSGANSYSWAGATSFLNSTSGSDVIFTGDTVLTSQNLIVTGNTGGCTSTLSITVGIDTLVPTINILNFDEYVCLGSASNILVSGALSYSWSGPAGTIDTTAGNSVYISPTNMSTPSIYTLEAQSGYCTAVHQFSALAVPTAQLSFSRTSGGNPVCRYGRDTISFSGNTTHYRITAPSGVMTTSSQQVSFSVIQDEEIFITGYTEYECPAKDSFDLIVDPSCVDSTYYVNSIDELNNTSDALKAYTQNNALVLESTTSFNAAECSIFDLSGQLVHSFNFFGTTTREQLPTALSSNIYILYIKDDTSFARKKLYVSMK